nr:prenyltransferase [Polynucleobacter asymbioticus]
MATRPTFLVITLLGCWIGFLSSSLSVAWSLNSLAVLAVLMIHASSNLLNDYFDYLNGTDLININRISPFTGGSRFIQDNVFSPGEIFRLSIVLLALSALIGLYLCYTSTWKLLAIGITGVFFGWSYSAPPLKLMSRGILGEIAIASAWSLVVIGFSVLQNGQVNLALIPLALAYGLMVANILFLNQIPDIEADRNSSKETIAVKTLPHKLWKWYSVIFMSAYILQAISIFYKQTYISTLITLVMAPIFIFCAIQLRAFPLDRTKQSWIIPLNIIGVHLYALLICMGLFWG